MTTNGPSHTPEEGPLVRVRDLAPTLSGTAKACAEFVLTNALAVHTLSITEFAARAGVSINAANRFARTLGYRGYRDFTQAMGLEAGGIIGAAYAIPPALTSDLAAAGETPATVGATIRRVFALELLALQDTFKSLDLAAAERAVAALAGASKILLLSTGAGLGVAQLAAYRLKVLGLPSYCEADPATILPEIHLLRPGDVMVAITFHGQAPTVIDGLEHARARGITTICVSAVPGSAAIRAADIGIVVSSPGEAIGFGQFASRVATLTVLEALAAGVAWTHRDTSLPHALEVSRANQRRSAAVNRSRVDPQAAAGSPETRRTPKPKPR